MSFTVRGESFFGCNGIRSQIRPVDEMNAAQSTGQAEARGIAREQAIMTRFTLLGTAALLGFAAIGSAIAADDPMVGGAPMYASKNIIENAINSKDHTTLVAAVKAAGLVDTLEGTGPFTVFAPTNEAFAALPAGTVDTLLKPENKPTLDKVLTYHVVPGRLDTKALDQQIMSGGGKASLKTVEGDMLTVTGAGKNLMVTDDKGNTAKITIADVYQSNGVILVVDKVLMPN
jgi:uncharacterized surface protein with fasciclin (FAS1) repeats